ncbi:MAG TPA: hypothetical protein DCS11_07150 [Syntrophus sp. (in: bacteria)]|nr:hypothetical protein [Syntrophus sp. (in: bacteria)]
MDKMIRIVIFVTALAWPFTIFPCTDDPYEPDNSCIRATAFLAGGETQSRNFCADAWDWIDFQACAGRSYTIATSNLGPSCDTLLELYAADCSTLLASDDNGGGGLASKIDWTAPGSGTYHIRVTSVGGSTGDDQEYDLTLTGDTSPCSLWFVDYDGSVESPSEGVLQATSEGGSILLTRMGTLPQFDTRVLKLNLEGIIEWEQSYSIDAWDSSRTILATSDGGYLFVGSSSDGTAADEDLHAVKISAAGAVSWHRRIGGSSSDKANSAVEDPGAGYIIAGVTGSYGSGSGDAWIVKLDLSGSILWQKAYGHTGGDGATTIERLSNGNLIFAGYTDSFGASNTDGWVVQTNASGTILWERRYGGSGTDYFYSIQPTLDGGFIAAGLTGWPNQEGWVVKMDAAGIVQWEKSYGFDYFDMFFSIRQTHDGGFIAAGTYTIFATPQEHAWLVKLDSTGTIQWQRRYTGQVDMRAVSIRQLPDEGYLAATDRALVFKVDDAGSTGFGCPYSTATSVTPADTGYGSFATTAVTTNTAATATAPGLTAAPSSAVIEDACPCLAASASIDAVLPSLSECAGMELTFSGSGSGFGTLTYQWDFDYDGITFHVDGSGASVNHIYSPPSDTVYTVALRVSDSCSWGPAQAIDTTTVTVWSISPVITGPAGVCRGTPALLDAGAGYSSYLWSPGGETTQTISVSPYADTLYSVTVADSHGCLGSDGHALAIGWNPVPAITERGECGAIILDAGAGYDTYLWSPGGATTQTINIGTDTTTIYSVTVSNAFGCTGSDAHQASSACPADPYEPDDACADGATLLHGGDIQRHNFCDDAEDWFMFHGAAGRSYTLETLDLCPSADTIMELYDTDGATLLASDDDGGTGNGSKLEWTAPGHGAYHLRVRNSGGASGPDLGYAISLTGNTGPSQLWFKTFDLTDAVRFDRIFSVDRTPDGGLIIAGATRITDYDAWLFKLDALGAIEWEQKYASDDYAAQVHSLPGGNYGLAFPDGTVMKLDGTGTAIWQKRLNCALLATCPTEDGGLLVAGRVNNDFYAARLDPAGNLLWQKTYGGTGDESARSVSPTRDGGFVLAGYAGSFGTSPEHMWILRLDGSGNILWQRAYGADTGSSASAICSTEDGGFIVGGYTWFSGGLFDPLVLKLTADGNIQWQRVIPNDSSQDGAGPVLQSSDGGYVIKGSASPSAGDIFFRLAKLDPEGTVLWQNAFRGDDDDLIANPLMEGIDGSLIVGGFTADFGVDLYAGFVMKADMNGEINAACPIIGPESTPYADPLLDSIVTAVAPVAATQTIQDVTISSTAIAGTVADQCATCLEVSAFIAGVTPSSAVCRGVEQTFSAHGFGQGALTYQWDFDYDGVTFGVMATGSSVSHTYPSDGTFTAAVRVTDACGDPGPQSDIGTVEITIYPLPTPAISGPDGICLGDPPVILDAGAGYASYLWSPGGATTRTISVNPATTTVYSVTVTTAHGCQGSDDHTLNVYAVPSPTITEYCFGSDIILDAGDGFETYLWSPGGEATQTINVGDDTATTYSITVTYPGGCEGTDDHQASGPCTASGDRYEEDDTCLASGTVLDGGTVQNHDFLDDGVDWVSFNACTGRPYTIETSDPGALTDTVLELYDTDCATLLAFDDNGGGDGVSSRIEWTAPADGLYHVRVRQGDNTWGPDRGYAITLTGDTSACSAWARSFGKDYLYSWDSGHGVVQAHDGGFMIAGVQQSGESEGDIWLFRLRPDGSTVWEKTYPGPNTDAAFALDRTSDGSYVIAGPYQQYSAGNYRFQAMTITDSGAIAWEQTYGWNSDIAYAVKETSDGGFIMAGIHHDEDSEILKLDPSGNPVWGKVIGLSGKDYFNDVVQAFDGGFLAVGHTGSSNDIYLVRLDGSGNMVWRKTYGGTGRDEAHAVLETPDGGFIVAGETGSHGAGGKDLWVLKLDMAGTLVWQKTYGSTGNETARAVTLTRDGGYAVAGESDSFGTGNSDLWVLKLFSTGEVAWQKRYGGTGNDGANSIKQSADGGYIITGYTISYGAGDRDFWVLKTRADGSIDPSCDFIFDTAVSAQNSDDSWGYPSPFSSVYQSLYTTITTPQNSAAATSEQCSFTACLPVTASISGVAPSATVCQGQEQTFTGSGSGEGAVTLEWDFDFDGITFDVMDTGSPATYTYPSTGPFTAALRVTDACHNGAQEALDTVLITIPDPTPTITGPAAVCQGQSAELDAGAGYSSYLWSPGGQTTQLITVSPAITTLYLITVTDANGCEGTDDHNLIVHPNPSPAITGPVTYCTGAPAITLDAGAGYAAYLWSPGGAITQTIVVSPAVTTTYAVVVTDDNTCQGSDDHTVTVVSPPPTPQDFSVTPECGKIVLAWTDGPYETGYRIERDAGSGFSLLAYEPAGTVTYEDAAVADGVSYTYRVRAENACGVSGFTDALAAATNTAVYAATSLSIDTAYCNALVFAWTDAYAAETGYVIERDIDSAGSWEMIEVLGPGAVLYGDHAVTEGSDYSYRVSVRNLCGDSAPSNVITMTPDCSAGGASCLDPAVLSVDEMISSSTDWIESSSIAWNGDHFGIVWADSRDGGEWKIIFAKMDAYGDLVSGSVKTIGDGELGNPDIAWNGSQFGVAASGNIACAEGGVHIYFFTLDADGDLTSPQVPLSCGGWWYGNNFNPKVHWNGSTWGVVWESWAWGEEEVLFQRLNVSAAPQHAPPLWISSSGSGLWAGNPDITSLGGEWFIVWEEEDATDSEIHYSRRNADGTAISSSALTNDGTWNGFGRIAANDSLIGLTYIIGTEPYFRAFNPDGSWATTLQKLDTTPDCRATDIATTGNEWGAVWQEAPVYDDPPDVGFQRIDSSGNPVGGSINVTANDWDSWGPRIAWASDRWGLSYTENINWSNANAYGAVIECGSVGSAPPSAPRNLGVLEFCSLLAVHWIDTSPDEDAFVLERSVNGGSFSILATLPANAYFYLDEGVSASNAYAYRVKASNGSGDSDPSNTSPDHSPDDCPITDLLIESAEYNPDGTITFTWTGIDWQNYVDVYRGNLDGNLDIYDTIVDCTFDAETGTYTTTFSQEAVTNYFYYIAPKIGGGNFFGYDSEGQERSPTGPLCP